ncbi:methyltransferase domain-containing protein [Hydrogenophaga sp. 5NK40-0174]|uniref:class I SAM-dependent methyltransferase n=1 Tax=Hydrogenophaga sp. 5NK40-0174 TaxID=3127649 RepID=UPI0031029A3A
MNSEASLGFGGTLTVTASPKLAMLDHDAPKVRRTSGCDRLERAVETVFTPGVRTMVCGTLTARDEFELGSLPGQWESLTVSPWNGGWRTGESVGPRYEQVLILADTLPSDDAAIASLVDCMEHWGADHVLVAVSGGTSSNAELRHRIERQAFDAGYRKHPFYYTVLDYEGLHEDNGTLVIPLECMPREALITYPLSALREERDLHMDMTREPGERSDAHVIRYQEAARLIRAGDKVLDAACGLGYGSYLMASQTRCASVHGVDGSDYAVEYAGVNFASVCPRLSFDKAWLPQGLSHLPSAGFDVIVSFETLEHIEDPTGLLKEFDRLLKPGGRIIVSVPNDWSDETGEDPNPFHLHVYTLDKLRQQFARHFSATALHQQIASGCKSAQHGNKWMPMRRVLRELPVQAQVAPDSEWWLLSGTKPCLNAEVDLSAPWYAKARRPWKADFSHDILANGIVLAVNCVPTDVAPELTGFWTQLSEQLAARGFQLVLLSTAPVDADGLQVIEMPFEVTAFPAHYGTVAAQATPVTEREVMDVAAWYGCTYDFARESLGVAHGFVQDMLDTLRPSAVLGWQSSNPLSKLIAQQALKMGLPHWSGERGWVRNTLMFDLAGNNALSEMRSSLALRRLRQRFEASRDTLAKLTRRARSAADLGRYASKDVMSREAFRAAHGIGPEDRVTVFFGHGEPSVLSTEQPALRELHDLPDEVLEARVLALAHSIEKRGGWLLVQEHPFNRSNGRELALPQSSRVKRVEENVSTLLQAADQSVYTLATLQYDAAFLDKPVGLLCHSPLYRAGLTPCISDFESADAFLDALADAEVMGRAQASMREDVAFMFENMLIDIEGDAVIASAEVTAEWLSERSRPVDAQLPERIETFLTRWAAAS